MSAETGRELKRPPRGEVVRTRCPVRGYARVPPCTTRISRVGLVRVMSGPVCHAGAGAATNRDPQGSVTAPRSAPVTRRAYLASTPVV